MSKLLYKKYILSMKIFIKYKTWIKFNTLIYYLKNQSSGILDQNSNMWNIMIILIFILLYTIYVQRSLHITYYVCFIKLEKVSNMKSIQIHLHL